ncbi:MAG: hypothetical protein KGJ86_13470 [Chloroflexota bacterium]|nr:hypothetical protein [Chloroflexota bacterium]
MAAWTFGALRVSVLAFSMIFGPVVADAAWDFGNHVTPGQNVVHSILEAHGIQPHHDRTSDGIAAVAAESEEAGGASLQAGSSSFSFGTPLSPVSLTAPFAPPLLPAGARPAPFHVVMPPSHLSPPDSPPPRTAPSIFL